MFVQSGKKYAISVAITILTVTVVIFNFPFLTNTQVIAADGGNSDYAHLVRKGDRMHCESGGTERKCGPTSAEFWNAA